jgi:uncharacterized lipoprotein YmbA
MAYVCVPTSRLFRVGLGAVALGLLALSVAGCVRLLEPRTSDATYYILGRAQQTEVGTTDTTRLSVGLREPRLASYLDPTRIVTRRGPHTIDFAEFHRWGEDLDRGINRTVAQTLEARSDIRSVEAVPWPEGATFDYVVKLHVLRFEGVGPRPDPEASDDAPPPDGHSQMTVQWAIHSPEADTVLARGQTRHRTDDWRVNNYGALVEHLSQGLDVLVDEIGTRLQALDRPQPDA